ncbi:MAG: hypothetical protein ACJAX5_002868 [Patiriisocius sp.]|jgi:hypothetical protein
MAEQTKIKGLNQSIQPPQLQTTGIWVKQKTDSDKTASCRIMVYAL